MKVKSPENYFVIIAASILLLIVIAIIFISFSTSVSNNVVVTPTPQPTSSTDQTSVDKPPLYNEAARNEFMDKIEHRRSLLERDSFAKAKILASLPQDADSGVLYQSPTITIDYIKGPDLFQVEIFTTDINQAKREGNAWFLTQGMSQKGICDLPVQFYINGDIKDELLKNNIPLEFNPLAPACN